MAFYVNIQQTQIFYFATKGYNIYGNIVNKAISYKCNAEIKKNIYLHTFKYFGNKL